MMFLTLALLGCKHQAPPAPPASTSPRGSHVVLQTGLAAAPPPPTRGASAERSAMLRVLKESESACRVCYERAVARDPYAYGDIKVVITLAADGGVEEAAYRYSTLGDAQMEACVMERVALLQFPRPSKPGLTLAYPFIFTSDLTPREVTRALLVQHGLEIAAGDEPLSFEEDDEPIPAQGEDGWWETW